MEEGLLESNCIEFESVIYSHPKGVGTNALTPTRDVRHFIGDIRGKWK